VTGSVAGEVGRGIAWGAGVVVSSGSFATTGTSGKERSGTRRGGWEAMVVGGETTSGAATLAVSGGMSGVKAIVGSAVDSSIEAVAAVVGAAGSSGAAMLIRTEVDTSPASKTTRKVYSAQAIQTL
jgi:hypothetical protein